MGDKVSAKKAMIAAGVPTRARARKARCPTTRARSSGSRARVGYPVIIKAAGGGGGRGMRVVHTEAALVNAVNMTTAGGAVRLRQPDRLHGEVPREPAPHRDPGARRPAQERRLAGRARLLDAAPPPEDHRGSAGAGHRAQADRAHRRPLRRGLPQDRLPRRGHLRVPVRERRVLLHRDEHARAGRAPGDRDGDRHRHRAGADPRGRGREAARSGRGTS